jgi:serine/threonine-protein kinase
MELVEGRTLGEVLGGEPLPFAEFLRIGAALASALAAAHTRGITHRDIKPANVMVTADGQVKVLDFGLAKSSQTVADSELTQMATEALTQEGLIVGTLPYMSPEQVEGKTLDHRTDIFSLGVVLYEMATGRRPFSGDTQPALMSSILRDAPPSMAAVRQDLPRHVGRVIGRCLEKAPGRRFQSASSLAYELEGIEREHAEAGPPGSGREGARPAALERESAGLPLASSPGPSLTSGVAALREKTLAVLPFVNRSSNEDDQYFSDGLSEELINALSKLPGIRVTARSSAFQFRGREMDPREVGEKLGVDAVLEGSVRIAGARLRITTELVSCEDGLQLWSERFDGEMKDIFDTQDEIVQSIVEQFEVELRSGETARRKRGTDDLEAYQLLLRARHHATDFWEPGLVKAIECLEQAVALDPGYADAWAEMAVYELMRAVFGTQSGADAFPKTRAHAVKALELDPESADAHRAYGLYLDWHDLDWERGEAELRRALELDPDNVWGHFFLAGHMSTTRGGAAVLPPVRRMAELDPLNPLVKGHVALFLFYGGYLDEAIEEAESALELFPDFWLLPYVLSFFYFQKRDRERAVSMMERAIVATGESIGFLSCFLAAFHFHFGEVEEGERVMRRVDAMAERGLPISDLGLIVVEVVRGNADAAIELLERARVEHDPLFVWTRAFCEMQGILKDERVRATMERLGLP